MRTIVLAHFLIIAAFVLSIDAFRGDIRYRNTLSPSIHRQISRSINNEFSLRLAKRSNDKSSNRAKASTENSSSPANESENALTSSDSKDDANFSSMVRESAGSSSSGSSSDSDSGSSGSSDSASGIRGSSGSRDGGSDSDGGSVGSSSRHEVLQERAMREHLKQRLFARCAACDRGFSAVSADREAVASLIGDLMRITPEPAPTRNFFPNDNNVGGYTTEYNAQVPLVGCWQMIYTSALDVLSLAANPFTITQAIYQLLTNDGAAVNVIDVAPRLQALLPPSLVNDGSTLRLKVKIDAAARSEREVALNFKSLEVKPLRLLSNDVSFLPPLSVKLPQSLLPGGEKDQLATRGGPGFFEVLYLDEELLIIEQGAPGGIFISIRNNEPMESFL